MDIKLNGEGMKVLLGEESLLSLKNLFEPDGAVSLYFGEEKTKKDDVAIITVSNRKASSSLGNPSKDAVIEESLRYYLMKTQCKLKYAETLFESGVLLYEGLKMKMAVILDLSTAKEEISIAIAKMAFSLFGQSNILMLAPRIECRDTLKILNAIEELPSLSKNVPLSFKEDKDKAFDLFVCDLAELEKDEDEVVADKIYQGEALGKRIVYKEEASLSGDKTIVEQFNERNRQEFVFEKEPKAINIKTKKKKVTWKMDEFNKSSLSNLFFSVIFLALSIATSFIYFSFSSNNNDVFFVICLAMVLAFFVMSALPVVFQFSDLKKNPEVKKDHPNFILLTVLICVALGIAGLLSLLFVGKNAGYAADKLSLFVSFFIGYPIALSLLTFIIWIVGAVRKK